MSDANLATPQSRIDYEVVRTGQDTVVNGCVHILRGGLGDPDFIRVLGGLPAEQVLAGAEGGPSGYWPRVWAMRGLLYAYQRTAVDAVIDGCRDESWRVREMAAKVVARYRIADAHDAVSELLNDESSRVRDAATLALGQITAHRA